MFQNDGVFLSTYLLKRFHSVALLRTASTASVFLSRRQCCGRILAGCWLVTEAYICQHIRRCQHLNNNAPCIFPSLLPQVVLHGAYVYHYQHCLRLKWLFVVSVVMCWLYISQPITKPMYRMTIWPMSIPMFLCYFLDYLFSFVVGYLGAVKVMRHMDTSTETQVFLTSAPLGDVLGGELYSSKCFYPNCVSQSWVAQRM